MGKVRALPSRHRLWIRLGWVLAVASLGMSVLCFVLASRADGPRCGPDEPRGDCLASTDAAQLPLLLGGGFVLVTVLALAAVLGLRKTLVAAAAAQGKR
ncbi:hypothetical protein ABZ319_32530 [Nocardia sp. NPDC005978]|uniref:hypothetical protein n=1 Tax=Nocardia sp. NPDC005978 TaxID=3156725 RepID=UPI0033BEEF10